MQNVQVMEDDCNVEATTRLAEQGFGVDALVLVGANSLKIEDSGFAKKPVSMYLQSKVFSKLFSINTNLFPISYSSHGGFQ